MVEGRGQVGHNRYHWLPHPPTASCASPLMMLDGLSPTQDPVLALCYSEDFVGPWMEQALVHVFNEKFCDCMSGIENDGVNFHRKRKSLMRRNLPPAGIRPIAASISSESILNLPELWTRVT
ncbi:hypothetical protein PBY51_003413 [Eleginops maclovinus]|uniref:Uncharacterized protein n=1 Tax=Eleginops maclovinus TaxID=56733 RepID=A0AAN7Y110_ELEMC|nr:hypothetical protein PBY51_003413 [Eleginops maclovinus]